MVNEEEPISEAADRILLGASLRAICRDLNERGVQTVSGKPWTRIDRDTYLKTKSKLETQRREVDTKINAASGRRFLINMPRDREELKAAYENGNPSRANDRRRRADLLLRFRLAMAAARQRQEGAEVPCSTQLW